MCGTGIVDAAKENPRSHGDWDSVNNQSRIRDGERIKRILDWHTDGGDGVKAHVSALGLEWIGPKRHSCKGGIEK